MHDRYQQGVQAPSSAVDRQARGNQLIDTSDRDTWKEGPSIAAGEVAQVGDRYWLPQRQVQPVLGFSSAALTSGITAFFAVEGAAGRDPHQERRSR